MPDEEPRYQLSIERNRHRAELAALQGKLVAAEERAVEAEFDLFRITEFEKKRTKRVLDLIGRVKSAEAALKEEQETVLRHIKIVNAVVHEREEAKTLAERYRVIAEEAILYYRRVNNCTLTPWDEAATEGERAMFRNSLQQPATGEDVDARRRLVSDGGTSTDDGGADALSIGEAVHVTATPDAATYTRVGNSCVGNTCVGKEEVPEKD